MTTDHPSSRSRNVSPRVRNVGSRVVAHLLFCFRRPSRRPFPWVRPGLLVPSLLLAVLGGCEPEAPDPARYPVIPFPEEVSPAPGGLPLGTGTHILASPAENRELLEVVEAWARDRRQATGLPLPVGPEGEWDRSGSPIRVVLEAGLGEEEREGSYRLRVSRDEAQVRAGTRAGIQYGLETLSQLMGRGEGRVMVPAVEIRDAPRFSWRGMHLDVGRHFFPVEFIKKYLDLLAHYKMNVLHWHLTEDQGWRIEIDAYPRLTEVGSCREETILGKNFDPYVGDGIPHCGFYTKEEIRDVVRYARARSITVVPEIEMPGHSVAALAAYPELACTQGPFQVSTRWGVTRDIYCPTEETFTFLETVLTEVMELFPGPYIHIGGDEAPKERWEESPVAQEIIRREGLAHEEELQSWFIRRIEAFLNRHGRRLIGWDEILEGGLAPDATVMSWRGMSGGIEAARQGHDVIMTPTSHLYFDYYQGDTLQEPLAIGGYTPLERVYAFEPVPPELSPAQARHVLGAQGNVWTEYMKTPEHVEYMVLPRLLALSEVVWSPAEARDPASFRTRLPRHLEALDARDYTYRIPDVAGLEENRLVLRDSVLLEMDVPVRGGRIHYTLNGSEPGPGGPVYRGPLPLSLADGPVEVAARVVLADGRMGPVRRARFARTQLLAPVSLPGSRRRGGLRAAVLPGSYASVDSLPPSVDSLPPSVPRLTANSRRETTVARVALPVRTPREPFGLRLRGYIRVPRKGIFTFHLTSDDGSQLRIGDRTVVDHDGYHSASERSGQVALHRGWHPVEVLYFQGGGGAELRLEMEGPDLGRRQVPAHWLAHREP